MTTDLTKYTFDAAIFGHKIVKSKKKSDHSLSKARQHKPAGDARDWKLKLNFKLLQNNNFLEKIV